MPSSSYNDLPSSAIQSVDIDYGTDVVTVVYKSNTSKQYHYEVADGDEFDRQFLAEFDKEDFSVGAYLNQQISNKTMRELNEATASTYEQGLRESVGQPVVVNGVSRQHDPRRLQAQQGTSAPSMFDVNAAKFAKQEPTTGDAVRDPETR